MTLQGGNRFISELATRHGRRLRRFFENRLPDRADAPDLAQEVFLRLMRVDHHESIRSPEAYLFTVASHVLQQHLLRQSSVPRAVEISQMLADLQLASPGDSETSADAQQRLAAVERVLEGMPKRFSATLLLHRFGGFTIEEIAQQLGVSRPAAKKYLARALAQCQLALQDGDGVP